MEEILVTNIFLVEVLDKHILFERDSLKFIKLRDDEWDKISSLNDEDLEKLLLDSATGIIEPVVKNKYEPRKGHRLVINLTDNCNLACKYCYEDLGTPFKKDCNMTVAMAKKTLDFFREIYDSLEVVQFFGGEPLINYKVIPEICGYINKLYPDNPPRLTLNSNATLVNREVIDILNENNIAITISVDGDKEMHNTSRVFHDGQGSFDTVMKGIELINNYRLVPLMIEATISKPVLLDAIKRDICISEFIHNKIEPDGFHIMPICHTNREINLSSVDDETFDKFFIRETLYCLRSMKTNSPMPMVKGIALVQNFIHKHRSEDFCEIARGNFVVTPNGDLYPCYMMVGHEAFKCGNINQGVEKNKIFDITNFYSQKTISKMPGCNDCMCMYMCTACPACNYNVNKNLDIPFNDLCRYNRAVMKATLYELTEHLYSKNVIANNNRG